MKMDIRTNENQLVKFAVQGSVVYPKCYGWELARTGESLILPSVGGITYNVKVGDPVFGLAGDHIEPCVSMSSDPKEPSKDPNLAFNVFSCIGNEAIVISGDAKGAKGVVTGHHGGVEHVIVDFDDATLNKLTQDDKILIHAYGQGLTFADYPDIKLFSLDPRLLKEMGLSPIGDETLIGQGLTQGHEHPHPHLNPLPEGEEITLPVDWMRGGRDRVGMGFLGERIEVPVVAIVPGKLMGSGLGHNDIFKGDYDIQTSDREAIKKYKLDKLRLGDLVAIEDHDSSYGWTYKEGAVTIGVVIHTDSYLAGHGPGVQTVMTCNRGLIVPRIDPDANIGIYLKIGRWR